ncbi:MAG: hypothetical protein V3U78_08110 [Thiotrichaceae bacterium]
MPSHFLKSLAIAALTLVISQTTNAQHSDNPKLGINVGDLGKLTSSIPFTDIFKSSRGWFTSCEFDWQAGQPIDPGCTRKTSLNTREQNILQLDGNGWVRSLPSPQDAPVFTSVTSIWKLSEYFPIGRYVVLYDGQGTMKITGDLRMGFQRPGHIEFDLLSPKRNLKLQITRTDPRKNGEYIRNIVIVPKKNEQDYKSRVFNPDYLKRVRPMHSLRFMPWTNPRSNEAIEWNQRARIGTAHYTGKNGIPAERMVDLANATRTTPWLSIPYKASDDYIRQYARMVKNRLRKNQKVYVEYSNEVWNTIFPAATYAARKADKLWKFPYKEVKGGKRRVLLAANWYAKRSVEMCRIWKQEFGGQRNRVKCVVGSLNSVPWVGKEILDCPLWKEANGCGRHIDAYGIGPYFGDYIARKENRDTVKSWTRDADGGKGRLFKEILEGGMIKNGPAGGSMSRLKDQLYSNKKLADKYGLPLLAYEAGQHLIRYDPPHTVKDPAVLNLFMSAQKDPRMQEAYQRYLSTWASFGGGLMLHFYGIGQPEPKNFFGMLDHLQQPSTPKYLALMDYLGDRSTFVPSPDVKLYTPSAAEKAVTHAPKQQSRPAYSQVAQRAPAPVTKPRPQVTPRKREVVIQQPRPTSPQVTAPQPKATTNGPITGSAINGWERQGNAVISPEIHLQHGIDHRLTVQWHFENITKSPLEYFKIVALDNKGGRKVLYAQYADDISTIGNLEQIYEEDINRYLGPPIKLVFEISPGLRAVISELKY